MAMSNPNPNPGTSSKNQSTKKRSEFEFCKVCKLNHDQGQRHKFFPSHKKSLSIFFSKFQTKLSDIRFFLRNPSLLRPEHASRNRLWCVICDLDIDELGGSFACNNAINHLASKDHLKNLKHFLWKNGGGSDSVDKFRITEAEFAKWEKKCNQLKNGAASSRKAVGPLNNIHNELNYVNTNSNSTIDTGFQSANSKISNGVIPLRCNTNEYQESSFNSLHGEDAKIANQGLFSENVTSASSLQTHSGTSSIGNVQTGALPPWLEAKEFSQLNSELVSVSGGIDSGSTTSEKSEKSLSLKRVGAAWAERRLLEMKMVKRGETVMCEEDGANYFPNYGGVWQSGSRKQSRKEFLSEKQKSSEPKNPPEEVVKIQPYVSKRMLRDAHK